MGRCVLVVCDVVSGSVLCAVSPGPPVLFFSNHGGGCRWQPVQNGTWYPFPTTSNVSAPRNPTALVCRECCLKNYRNQLLEMETLDFAQSVSTLSMCEGFVARCAGDRRWYVAQVVNKLTHRAPPDQGCAARTTGAEFSLNFTLQRDIDSRLPIVLPYRK